MSFNEVGITKLEDAVISSNTGIRCLRIGDI